MDASRTAGCAGAAAGAGVRADAAAPAGAGVLHAEFLDAAAGQPLATISDELQRLGATSEEQVRSDVMRLLGDSEPPAALAGLLEDPRRALGELADVLGRNWSAAIDRES